MIGESTVQEYDHDDKWARVGIRESFVDGLSQNEIEKAA